MDQLVIQSTHFFPSSHLLVSLVFELRRSRDVPVQFFITSMLRSVRRANDCVYIDLLNSLLRRLLGVPEHLKHALRVESKPSVSGTGLVLHRIKGIAMDWTTT